jgi:phosphoserine aminotransferase
MTKGVKASAGHVYASGYIAVAPYETSNRTVRAVYWKDGELQFVEQSTPSSAGSLDIEGNDVYVPYNTISNGTSVQMKYWKNGEKVVVDESVLLFSYDLTVSGGDVYMAGTYKKQSTDDAIATYWVNGERVPLQSEKESQAVACFVVRRQ